MEGLIVIAVSTTSGPWTHHGSDKEAACAARTFGCSACDVTPVSACWAPQVVILKRISASWLLFPPKLLNKSLLSHWNKALFCLLSTNDTVVGVVRGCLGVCTASCLITFVALKALEKLHKHIDGDWWWLINMIDQYVWGFQTVGWSLGPSIGLHVVSHVGPYAGPRWNPPSGTTCLFVYFIYLFVCLTCLIIVFVQGSILFIVLALVLYLIRTPRVSPN